MTIEQEGGVLGLFVVVGSELRMSGAKNKRYYTVECPECSHQITAQKPNILRKKACPGCKVPAKKPAALKQDEAGNCISICRTGQLEFIRDLMLDGTSERSAAKSFVEAVKEHSQDGDALIEGLTVEQVRNQYKRDLKVGETSQVGHPDPKSEADDSGTGTEDTNKDAGSENKPKADETRTDETVTDETGINFPDAKSRWVFAERIHASFTTSKAALKETMTQKLWAEISEAYGW